MSEVSDADAHIHQYEDAQKRLNKWMKAMFISGGTLVVAIVLVILFTFMASVGQLNETAYAVLVFVLAMVCILSLVCCTFAVAVTLVRLARVLKLRSQQPDAQE